ncbi:MAG: UDP-3-O-(3-hydroxymyristoyl)glucosamine N-acyltransferase [Betaproteobacteria bacterium]|nr:UDP-3-O-(3-hydroxymyristoyl)glucosamine N-acyltransferase [Betaproteobacteria bacterium]
MGPEASPGFTAAELQAHLGGELIGIAPDRRLRRLASLESAGPDDLSFLASTRLRARAAQCRAGLFIVSAALARALPAAAGRLLVSDPYAAYAAASRWLQARQQALPPAGFRHPASLIDSDARVHPQASIGPGAVIEAGAEVGEGAVIGAQVFIGAGARIGERTVLHHRVTVYHGCEIGADCLIHAGTVIGADGFGFAPGPHGWAKIAQLGRVIIGNVVEIGANCAIDRGALDDTLIGDGCKLDNLIQVGHNVRIGEHTAIAGCVGIAGSAVIGRRCMIGGGAGILGHLSVCDGAVVSAMSLVTRSITEPGLHTGVFPLMPNAQWERAAASLKQLPALRQRLRELSAGARMPDPGPDGPSPQGPPANDSRD